MGRTRALVCLCADGDGGGGVFVGVLQGLITVSKVFTSPFKVVSLRADTGLNVFLPFK